jgi:hypothetical protein
LRLTRCKNTNNFSQNPFSHKKSLSLERDSVSVLSGTKCVFKTGPIDDT